jgi:hypothetical protein
MPCRSTAAPGIAKVKIVTFVLLYGIGWERQKGMK